MYRVELKACWFSHVSSLRESVPNVPCGVESLLWDFFVCFIIRVPNVPCGVESAIWRSDGKCHPTVPNVPCGVESDVHVIINIVVIPCS